jgi:hypothetical protein
VGREQNRVVGEEGESVVVGEGPVVMALRRSGCTAPNPRLRKAHTMPVRKICRVARREARRRRW